MTRRKHKPKSPEEIALDRAKARELERERNRLLEFGVNTDVLALPSNADVVVTMDRDKRAKVQTARRGDVFDRLLNDGQLRAVRRLEADIAEQMGQSWRPGQRVTVDSSQFPPGQNVSQMQIDAGERVQAVARQIGNRCWWVLHSLIVRVEVGYPARKEGETREEQAARAAQFDWRRVVSYCTGETNEQAQGARVRAAADNLAEAYGASGGTERRTSHNSLTD